MRRRIRLADHLGREATVWMSPCKDKTFHRFCTESGEAATATHRMKATALTHPEALSIRYTDPIDLARTLIAQDPEVDIERTGRLITHSERVWVDGDGEVLYCPRIEEVRRDATGQAVERRLRRVRPSNLVPSAPAVWSGLLLSRNDVVSRYELARSYQLFHGNTLEFDFLWGLADWLDRRGQMALLGRGRHGRDPLIMYRGAKPCLGFLDGRIHGEAMRIVLYLARGELDRSRKDEHDES
jgi:hypothetical protein